MSLELTFKSVCATIKKQEKNDPELIKAVDNLLGLALVCSPVVLGPQAAAILPLIAAKNEVIKIGKYVFERFTKKKDEDYVLRYETMRTAYGLLVFTSFFDALDAIIPDVLRKEISILDAEKAFLVKSTVEKIALKKCEVEIEDVDDAPVSLYPFSFPHPTESLNDQCKRQEKLWKQMGSGFLDFVQKLAFWDKADEEKKVILLSGIEKIEKKTATRFEAQYFELARKYEDFAVWANLQAHRGTKALIGELSEYVKLHVKLSTVSETTIDIGFNKLREAVLSIPHIFDMQQATDISESLNKHYQARINEPIIEDRESDLQDLPRLTFPRVCDAFVPQSFRVLRQAGKSRRLEDESTWRGLPRRNDLGAFLLSYLSSPYSTEAPLLILGHPGSGKSLLTKILSAQLMSKQFSAIRVPLREVNADADIVTQVEDTIRRITRVGFDSWIKLSALFKNCPPLVILDGYDELLQASGQVFASYIKDAQRFQEREAEQGRPLRIIITSRVTLIDKAAVPVGSTIIRLLEFDRSQRECWSKIWNTANSNYFRDANIEKFTLPSEKEVGAEKILNLAGQPLLLLMLALYDSHGNQLRAIKGLDRTKLYDSLLRRFVERERGKEKNFTDANPKEREKSLLKEMQRLGVAALGMYNRRKVHILSTELDEDLAFFKLERTVSRSAGKYLSQADLLLGSFFFVHKSKAMHLSGAEDTHEETAAFEFLHNTFGEFLTADFIIRRAVAQVQTLRAADDNEAFRPMIDKMMGTADGFERDWFASLVYTPLFTRPVIMEMIREWIPHVLKDYGLTEDDFVETLEKILLNQIMRMLNKREMPQIMRKETAQEGYRVPFDGHPLIGHIAIYSINLILLRLVSGKYPFIFDECDVTSHEDGTRPWDRLIHIWRSWFSLGNLNGLTAVMLAERANSKITIKARKKFQAEESKSRVQELFNVALSLGDNATSGITGLCVFDASSGSKQSLSRIGNVLSSEELDLGLFYAIPKLVVLANDSNFDARDFFEHAEDTLRIALNSGRKDQLEYICILIFRSIRKNPYVRLRYRGSFGMHPLWLNPRLVGEIAHHDPRSARILFTLARELQDYDWIHDFLRFLIESDFLKIFRYEKDYPKHTELGEWLRLLKDVSESEGVGRLFGRSDAYTSLFEKKFVPQLMLDLIKDNPEMALSYLRILREFKEIKNFKMLFQRNWGREVCELLGRSDTFVENPRYNSKRTFTYLLILHELNCLQYLHSVPDIDVFNQLLTPRDLTELNKSNPEGVLTYLHILNELCDEPNIMNSLERKINPELFGRIDDRHFLLNLFDRNPDAALAYLQMLKKLKGNRNFLQHVGPGIENEFYERIVRLSGLQTSTMRVWLAMARVFQSKRFSKSLMLTLSDILFDKQNAKQLLCNLPIASLADLSWLCMQTESPKLLHIVAEITGVNFTLSQYNVTN
ncbi:MAG TPA: ATP-binding protein [Desulfovibrio sp.]|uniref:NACHT domain-containing protein n=1 Tax=Desulfovibrio sp. TaxID=885 RepID=UPI002D4335AA|nr:ATP-binding protein [Desulfovibrio sp.]HZF61419.1 ATP-binding protein [Desulfovibrio sp.]